MVLQKVVQSCILVHFRALLSRRDLKLYILRMLIGINVSLSQIDGAATKCTFLPVSPR